MSKRPTAKQAANEPYWFAENQEVSKAVTQMTDPEYKVEFDGKETYVICYGVKLAMRRDDCWVSIEAAVMVAYKGNDTRVANAPVSHVVAR